MCAFSAAYMAIRKVGAMVEIEMFAFSRSRVSLSLVLDSVTALFLFTVGLIAMRVYTFRAYYVKRMPGYNQFHIILSIFVLSILLLVLSPNLFSIMLKYIDSYMRNFIVIEMK